MPASAATASAVSTMAWPAHGSFLKLSRIQCSIVGEPPGPELDGYVSSGPLLVRSVVITATTSPASAAAAPAWTHLADVAHAWAIIGPVMWGAPIFAASVG